jgi:hypothetical protein
MTARPGWTISAATIGRRNLSCILVGARWPEPDYVRALSAHRQAARLVFEREDDALAGDVRWRFGVIADPFSARYFLTLTWELGAPQPCAERVLKLPCDRDDERILTVGRYLFAGAPVFLDARRPDGVSAGERPLRAQDITLGRLLFLVPPAETLRTELLRLLSVAEVAASVRGVRLPLTEELRRMQLTLSVEP